ncbi:MAG: methyltransferase family protein [Promethearchaeota archaeon]
MYLVYFIFNLGLSLFTLNLILWGILVLGLIVVTSRMRAEEEMMIEQFGDEYRDYMKQTGRLFPRLRRKDDLENKYRQSRRERDRSLIRIERLLKSFV